MLKNLIASAIKFYRRYPARINSYIAAGIVAGASAVGLAIDAQTAGQVIAIVIPILIGGEVTHRAVKPIRN
jgi:hypothetical protein